MPADPFVVAVAQLRRRSGTVWRQQRTGPFDPDGSLAPRSPIESHVPDGATVTCDADLQSMAGGVMVTGTVRAPWQGVCRRCAVPVHGHVTVAVKERYVDSGRLRGGQPADEDAYPIVDDMLDLGPLVREVVLVELPLAPLCRTDCLGLCHQCGADRNEAGCGCVTTPDPRWASLDVLRTGPAGTRMPEHVHDRS